MFVSSTRESWTGNIIYSDSYHVEKCCDPDTNDLPLLNRLARIPVIGRLAGIARVAISIIHIVGHAIAALVLWDKQHLPHVAKGATELVRGLIESIPIVGFIFALKYDRGPMIDGFDEHEHNKISAYHENCNKNEYRKSRFFLIKIYNPNQIDQLAIFDPITQLSVDSKKLNIEDLRAGKNINLFCPQPV